MPCDTKPRTRAQQALQENALARLERLLSTGDVKLVLGPTGSVAFQGWTENEGLADLCAYRRLLASNSPELRKALARAQVTSGRSVNYQAIGAGVHSHDGGKTWHNGH